MRIITGFVWASVVVFIAFFLFCVFGVGLSLPARTLAPRSFTQDPASGGSFRADEVAKIIEQKARMSTHPVTLDDLEKTLSAEHLDGCVVVRSARVLRVVGDDFSLAVFAAPAGASYGSAVYNSENLRISIMPKEPVLADAKVDWDAALTVLNDYNIGDIYHILPTKGGQGPGGKSLEIVTSTGKYVLKPLWKSNHRNLIDAARFEVSVVKKLEQDGIPVTAHISTNKTVVEEEEDRYFTRGPNDKIYFLYRYIEGDILPMWQFSSITDEQEKNLGFWLARMHKSLEGFKPKGERGLQPLLPFDTLLLRVRDIKLLLETHKTRDPLYAYSPAEKFFLDNADFLAGQIRCAKAALTPKVLDILPKRIIHGDLHFWNAVFKGNKVVGVFDFDYLRFDIGIRDFFVHVFRDRTKDMTYNIAGLRQLVAIYESFIPLSDQERAIIPEFARYRALVLAGLIVYPEGMYERQFYKKELENVNPLQHGIWILDHHINGRLLELFASVYFPFLKSIDAQIRNGDFAFLQRKGPAALSPVFGAGTTMVEEAA